MQALEISRSALEVEWRRLEIIAQNLANANSSVAADRPAWHPLRLLSGPARSFAALVDGEVAFNQLAGVAVQGVAEVDTPPRKVHEPGHPDADADGFVTYPGLDHAAEMVLMVKTARAYEANIVAMGAARQMYSKALELGRSS
ncbi:flagellar basal body rod protein FlgC [Sphingomonas sanxanigenens]|uniref:Flagellar basal-body rod protein FlgC n=1 Tax=Sphingomonas sanxanigenens DSM 19645 = NX02 TaxID=1123269 RepID=W0AH81_9SPHN|nr:flagellar basal body rod protein FlgC [Sphingomonas sanxanigenens]AHE55653.1 hypothetical protein NX02_19970 [Sphingomonas sanxanigenens DSM 19645 = NX02]